MAALIDWAELDRLLAGISAAAKGEQGWPRFRWLCHRLLRNRIGKGRWRCSERSCSPPGTTSRM